MRFSKKVLLQLKNKNKKLKPDLYNRLKRQRLSGLIKGNYERPRLSIFRSNNYIYAQIINDSKSETLLYCSTSERRIRLRNLNSKCCKASKIMGRKLAKRSLNKNIKKIVFDRGPYLYHGRIKALADGARAGGLQF